MTTVAELRKLMADLPDDTPVFLRAWMKETYIFEHDLMGTTEILAEEDNDDGYGARWISARVFFGDVGDWEPHVTLEEEPEAPQTYADAVAAFEEGETKVLILSSEIVDEHIARL